MDSQATSIPNTLLLVDDENILYRSGTNRVLHPAEKVSHNPLLVPEHPWEGALAWSSIYRNPATGKYQLWYQSFLGKQVSDPRYGCVVCYAESEDGIRFHKPALDLFPFGEIEKTNIVLLGSGGHSFRYCNSVVVNPEDANPERRYKMAYFDWTETPSGQRPGLCVAFSRDGIHWEKHPDAPLLPAAYGHREKAVPLAQDTSQPWTLPLTMSDATDVFWDPIRKVYAWYGKMWIDGPDGRMAWKHAMGRTESPDFLHWSTPELLCSPDDQDPPHLEFHTTPVFYYQRRYFCLNQLLNRGHDGGTLEIELMLSHDGFQWQRPFRNTPFIPPGNIDTFDSGSIFTNSTPVFLEDEIRFYYGGYSHGTTGADNSKQVSGIGLAKIPRDRFAGIQPLEKQGQITLKPRLLKKGYDLTLNGDASLGTVRAELLNSEGKRMQGFTAQDAIPIEKDGKHLSIRWTGKKPSDYPSDPVLLRLHLENAAVYAVYQ